MLIGGARSLYFLHAAKGFLHAAKGQLARIAPAAAIAHGAACTPSCPQAPGPLRPTPRSGAGRTRHEGPGGGVVGVVPGEVDPLRVPELVALQEMQAQHPGQSALLLPWAAWTCSICMSRRLPRMTCCPHPLSAPHSHSLDVRFV